MRFLVHLKASKWNSSVLHLLLTGNVAYFLLLFQYIVFIIYIIKRNEGARRRVPMNLQHLRVFLAVAEHEHITRASEELVLSQPAVTKIIQNLEHEIGLELIERHGRRIVLTHAGHMLHNYARRMFALEREMEEALAVLQDVEAGEIKLAANTTTGVYLLP